MIGFTPHSVVSRHLDWCLARLRWQAEHAEMLARKVHDLGRMAERYEELLRVQAARHDAIIRGLELRNRGMIRGPDSDDSGFVPTPLPFRSGGDPESSHRRPSGLHENQTSDAKAPPPKSEQPDE